MQHPDIQPQPVLVRRAYTPMEQPGQAVLTLVAEDQLTYEIPGPDLYTVATQFAAIYRLDVWTIYTELKRLYPKHNGTSATVPQAHLPDLAAQIEEQTSRYRIQEETVEVALALIKPDGFKTEHDEDGNATYTTEITYHKDKEHLLLSWRQCTAQNDGDFGFHYDPYNFDSGPEKDFFLQMLRAIDLTPDQVEDIYFTGAITDPRKTDFYVEYLGVDGKWHNYSPDFVIRRKDGKCCIVEIKAERERNHPVDGENGRKAMAIRKWSDLNPDRLTYEMIFASTDTVPFNKLAPVKDFCQE
jgi:hypothetical protein